MERITSLQRRLFSFLASSIPTLTNKMENGWLYAIVTVANCLQIGTPTASVSKEVAQVQRLLKVSGLSYSMHSAGTTVEGPWDDVMRLMGQAHTLLHNNGVVRIQTDIRVGTRTDKKQSFQDKVDKVNSILAADAPQDGGDMSKKMQGVPLDAEGNAGHVAGSLQGKWGKDKLEEAMEKKEAGSEAPKGADVVTNPEVVGPGKVSGTWTGQVKE